MMVSTVAANAKEYTRREGKRAKEARRLMRIIGMPSEAQMRRMMAEGQVRNCHITEQDVINAFHIFGPDVAGLKGKATRRAQPHVELRTRPIPTEIMKRQREVTLCFDVMFVCGLPFAVSIARALKFGTVEVLANRKAETLLAALKRIKATYARRGFLVNTIAADNEFSTLDASLSAEGMALNVVSRGEHVPEVERHIRTLKERCRSMYNSLPVSQYSQHDGSRNGLRRQLLVACVSCPGWRVLDHQPEGAHHRSEHRRKQTLRYPLRAVGASTPGAR